MLKSMGLNKEGLNLVCWFVCLCTLLSSQFLAVIIPVVSNEEAMALKIHYPMQGKSSITACTWKNSFV